MKSLFLVALSACAISAPCLADSESRVAKKPEKPAAGEKPPAEVAPVESKPGSLFRGTVSADLEAGVITDASGNKIHFIDPVKHLEELERDRLNSGLSELELFATADHPHGFRLEDAARFRGHDTSGLVRMLREEQYEDYWDSIAVLIGVAGDKSALEELKAYYEDESNTSPRAISAKISALQGIGILGSRLRNGEITDYLADALRIEKWQARKDVASFGAYDFAASGVRTALVGLSKLDSPRAAELIRGFEKKLKADAELRTRMAKKDVTAQYVRRTLARAELSKGKDFFEAERQYRSMVERAEVQ